MAKLKVDQFVDLVKRSGLVDNERLNEALSGVDQSVKDSGIVASNLTKAGLLTEWQSEKLLQGRHKGFYLGKFKLLNHIGTGGMGSVYLAEHLVMHHRVAVKLLPKHLAAHSSYLERFHQEARASAKLNHPNLVRAHDVDRDGDNHYLVMDYVDGADLQAIVSRNGPLPFRLVGEYTRQAAEGLEYAHQVGLIHRDIKPANLLLDKTGTVKILDMGLARFSDETQSSLTMEYDQKMIGTVDYLAPEQALDSHRVDARVDIYSLGCTMYFMLTGDAPFPQGTIPQRLMQHQSAEPTDIRKTRPDCPEPLIAICHKMMAKRAEDRYQSAAEVGQALAAYLGDSNVTSESGIVPRQSTYTPPTASGPPRPSLNEDLTLAPLDEDNGGRAAPKPSKEAKEKAGGSKVTGSGSNPTVKKTGSSVIKNGESSSVLSGGHPAIRSGNLSKGGSAIDISKRKSSDLMDEFLANPTSGPNSAAAPGPPPQHANIFPIWLVVGLAVVMGFAVIFTVAAWVSGHI